MRLLPATPAMAADLAAVHAAAFPAPWSALEFVDLFATPGVAGLLVVEDAGPTAMILWRTILGEAELLTVATAPAARRRGLARALVQAAMDAAQVAGAEAMFLEVAVDNAAAVALYRALGFAEVGRRPGYYERGAAGRTDALVMRRDLEGKSAYL